MESKSFIIFYRNLTSAKCWVALNATPTPVHWENTWNLIALKSKNSTGEPKIWPTWRKDPLLPRPDTRLGHPDRPLLWTRDHRLSLRNNTCWLALLLCCKREVLWWLWKTCPVPRRPPRGCLVLWCHTSPGNPAKEVRVLKRSILNVCSVLLFQMKITHLTRITKHLLINKILWTIWITTRFLLITYPYVMTEQVWLFLRYILTVFMWFFFPLQICTMKWIPNGRPIKIAVISCTIIPPVYSRKKIIPKNIYGKIRIFWNTVQTHRSCVERSYFKEKSRFCI